MCVQMIVFVDMSRRVLVTRDMLVRVIMRMVVVVTMRHCVVMVVPAQPVLAGKLAKLAAVAGHQGFRRAMLHVIHTLLQHLKNLALETKIRRQAVAPSQGQHGCGQAPVQRRLIHD
jgi:hypothetical protein